jgi:HlyD family secretion protein
MSVRRSLIVLAFVTMLLPFVVFSARANQSRAASPTQNLQFYIVQKGNLEVAVNATGTIEAQADAKLSFTRSGRVVEILVNPGDYVKAGDLLARQVSDTEKIAVQQAQLSVQLAALQKQNLVKPPDDSSIKIAEANLNSAWGAYTSLQKAVTPEDITAAEVKLEQAEKNIQYAEDERRKYPWGTTDYQLTDAKVGAATFNKEIVRLQLDSLRNGNKAQLNTAYARVVQAKRELDRVKAGPTQAEIDRADIAIRQAQAQLDQAQMNLNKMTLIAPFEGVVSAVNLEEGALALPGMAVIQLTNVSPLHVTVQVDEVDIRQIREGMAGRVRLDALPGVELGSTLDQIALVGQNDNGIISYDVRVTLKENDPRVRVGMTADTSVIVDERKDVLVVPNLYIRLDRQKDKAFVNVMGADGKLKEVEIRLGLRGQDNSEVLAGLQPDDQVAVNLSGDRFSILGG